MKIITWALLAMSGALSAAAPAADPGKDFDLQGFLDDALKAGQRTITVPAGRYRVAPRHNTHLSFKNLSGVTMVTTGVEMICTKTCRAIGFENCTNVTFKGLTIDYDPLPMAEGRITALAPDKSWAEFEIIEGYPDHKLVERIEIYDPATGELRRTDPGYQDEIASLGQHRYRVTKHKGFRFRPEWDTEQVGDILVTINQFPDGAGGHAITSDRCVGLRLEDITLYSSPCFGFVEHRCDGNTYLRCKIDRRPAQGDLVKRGFPRMRSLTADAFHSTEALKGPAIVDCTAKFQGDDCVNIHGTYHFVTASTGHVLRIGVTGRLTIEPGDAVEFLPYAGARPPDAVAKALEPDGPITEAEQAFLRKLHLNPHNKERYLNGQAKFFKLTLDRALDVPIGTMVCAANRMGNGFLVKGCDFGFNRSRGILIKASHGQVFGNKITHGWMAAVLVSPEYWWSESGSSCDVTVRDNEIVGCRMPAIEIVAPGGNGKPLPSGTHRDIAVLDNKLRDCAWPNLRITSTAGLVIKGNRLDLTEPKNFVPPLAHTWSWGTNAPAVLSLENCEQPQVQALR